MSQRTFRRLLASIALISMGVAPWFASSPVSAAPPSFSAAFSPDVIGPGSTTLLQFDIIEPTASGSRDLGFTATLPTGVFISQAPAMQNSCGGRVAAVPGGTTITLSEGSLGGTSSCILAIHVTSDQVGTYELVTGDLTSSTGNSGTASDTLSVDTDIVGVTKSFSPAAISYGARSSVTITFDNTLSTRDVEYFTIIDPLPTGMVVADPADASSDCGTTVIPPTVSAVPGDDEVALEVAGTGGFPALAAGALCTLTFDVVANIGGSVANITDDLSVLESFSTYFRGWATGVLDVAIGDLLLVKRFVDDPAGPGSSVTIEYTLLNRNRGDVTGITFDDDLDATLTGLTFSNVPTNPCGPSSAIAGDGTSMLTFAGGSLPAGGDCSFTVTGAVPAGATVGEYPSTTSQITGSTRAGTVSGPAASDTLFVAESVNITKEYLTDPVGGGQVATLEFTIDNPGTSPATNIEFSDILSNQFGFPATPSGAPVPDPPCGPTSSIHPVFPATDVSGFALSGGSLAAGDSCTFTIDIAVPATSQTRTVSNTTSAVTATIDGNITHGSPATDDLTIIGTPRVTKSFNPSSTTAGTTVTLNFVIDNSDGDGDGGGQANDHTNVGFTDDLASMLPGATFATTNSSPCGTGSSLTTSAGDTMLTLTGGSVAAGETCSFSVAVNVPAGAAAGQYTNTTSAVTTNASGLEVEGPPASAELFVTSLTATKAFSPDTIGAGDTTTLTITVDNSASADGATDIGFTDDLDAMLPGATVSGPVSTCGGNATAIGDTLMLSNGSVAAGSTCTVSATVTTPNGATPSTYRNTTSAISFVIDGTSGQAPPATADLTIDAPASTSGFTKEFIDDPVVAGGTATLQFTITNASATSALSSLTFTDDLDAMLAGATASGLPQRDVCGAGSQLTGTSVITLAGGSVDAGGSCTFEITVNVPASASGSALNTTSDLTGQSDGRPTTLPAASDQLEIATTSGRSFDLAIDLAATGPVVAGQPATWRASITNHGPGSSGAFEVITNLDGALSGAATTGCAEDPAGLPTCSLSNLEPNETTSFEITANVAADATGSVENAATAVASGPGDSDDTNDTDTSTDDITVTTDLAVSIGDSDDPATAGTAVTYELTVTNNGPSDATGVIVSPTIPTGTTLVSTSGCAEDPAGVPSCTLGTVPAGSNATVTITVDIAPDASSPLTASASVDSASDDPDATNNSATENTELEYSAELIITADATPEPVVAGDGQVTHTFTVTNNGPSIANDTTIEVDLPAGFTPNQLGSCTDTTPLVCPLGAVPVGTPTTVTIVSDVDHDAPASLVATGSVTTSSLEADTSDNSASATTSTSTVVDLQITSAITPSSAEVGSNAALNVGVTNAGPSTAPSVEITVGPLTDTGARTAFATAPIGFTAPAGCTMNTNGTATCSVGALAPQASTAFEFTISADRVGTFEIASSAAFSGSDTNPADNVATSSFSVIAATTSTTTTSTTTTQPATSPPTNTPTTTMAPTLPPTTDVELPATGGHVPVTQGAAALVLIGLLILGVTRRRSAPTTP